MQVLYSPLIKTTDAEIKGFQNLYAEVMDNILPIIELTKSRKTSKEPDGPVEKRLKDILEATSGRPFIADLTTEETLLNDQIIKLYDPQNGYARWREFLRKNLPHNVIPSIAVNADGNIKDVTRQAQELEQSGYKIAFRASLFDTHVLDYIAAISAGIEDDKNLILILDGQFLGKNRAEPFVNALDTIITTIETSAERRFKYIQLSSCFPASVTSPGYFSTDAAGKFSNEDVAANALISENRVLANRISYGDYGSVHPVRYPTRGGGFVPRVDLPLEKDFIYRRYRREDGGYVKAAKAIVELPEFKTAPKDAWGYQQIIDAASGAPKSLGPVFWIGVRLNIHITRQLARIKKNLR